MHSLAHRLGKTLQQWGAPVARVMEERPVLTNSILCFHLWVAGDLLAQSYEYRGKPWDYTRTLQAASYGGMVSGPLYALWYPWLDRQVVAYQITARWFRNSPWADPMVKVAADEILMDPPTIALFFGYMDYCQHDMTWDADRVRHKVVMELPGAWVTSLLTWPAVLLATFRWVPLYAQPAIVNLCAILWDGFLSHRNAVATYEAQAAAAIVQRRTTRTRLMMPQTRSAHKQEEKT